MDGRSFLGLLTGRTRQTEWRDYLLYEYFWEWNYPHTPTIHALRDSRYKYIRYHGIWDTDELYDLKNDPQENYNLINEPEHQERIASMKNEMFMILNNTNGQTIPFHEDRGRKFYHRNRNRARQGDFPAYFYEEMEPVSE